MYRILFSGDQSVWLLLFFSNRLSIGIRILIYITLHSENIDPD